MQKALYLGEHAVKVAKASGKFIVHALNELCRTAKAAGDYHALTAAIESLLDQKIGASSMDSAFECDFLIGLPEGAVPENLIHRLHERCSRHS